MPSTCDFCEISEMGARKPRAEWLAHNSMLKARLSMSQSPHGG